jgi:C4-dicarboxylate transporter DctM subunit
VEVVAALLLVLPIPPPALQPPGVDPVHFSASYSNMETALVHPPVGLNFYVLFTISSAPDRGGDPWHSAIPDPVFDGADDNCIFLVLTMWLPTLVFGN